MVGIGTRGWAWWEWYARGFKCRHSGTGISEKNGYKISFNGFLRVGFPFMIITVASGSVILLIDILIRLPSGT